MRLRRDWRELNAFIDLITAERRRDVARSRNGLGRENHALASSSFVGRFSAALGGDSWHSRLRHASHISAQTLNLYSSVQSGLRDVSPRVIANPNLNTAQAIQQQIPIGRLFSDRRATALAANVTPCTGLRPILSIFCSFCETRPPNAVGNSPLDILIGNAAANPVIQGRRPDYSTQTRLPEREYSVNI